MKPNLVFNLILLSLTSLLAQVQRLDRVPDVTISVLYDASSIALWYGEMSPSGSEIETLLSTLLHICFAIVLLHTFKSSGGYDLIFSLVTHVTLTERSATVHSRKQGDYLVALNLVAD